MEETYHPSKAATKVDSHSTRKRKTKSIDVVSGPKLVFDIGLFPKDITFEKQTEIVSEFFKIYCFDKDATKTLPIQFYNVNNLTWKQLFHRFNGLSWNKKIVELKKNQIKDEFKADDIIYLCPCAEDVCNELDDSKCYLINSYDKDVQIPEFIKSENIKCQRLPINNDKMSIEDIGKILINVKNFNKFEANIDK